MFTRRQIIALLIPLMLEQLFSGLMGIADTMMVTSVSDSAISAVSNVNAINTLVFYMLVALATGGVIVCAQHLGRGEKTEANAAAKQALLSSVVFAAIIMLLCLMYHHTLLSVIFGAVEQDVMKQAQKYFLLTALSYPFLAAQQTAAAIFRASGRSTPTMVAAAGANVLNILGNAILIFGFHLGVVGAALATLFSRIFNAAVLLILLRNEKLEISIRNYLYIRPDKEIIFTVLRVGIPSGIENSMFELGKLLVQSTVATLGTAAMAAQAMIHTLDVVICMPSLSIGTGLLTVVGQCMGARRINEAKRYTRKFCIYSEITLLAMSALVLGLTPAITRVTNMSSQSAELTIQLMIIITIAKCTLWVMSFTLPNCMQAAGDVKFTAFASALSMWVFRVGGCLLLCRGFNMNLIGVWIAWFCDWAFRGAIYIWRYRSNIWQTKQVLRQRKSGA